MDENTTENSTISDQNTLRILVQKYDYYDPIMQLTANRLPALYILVILNKQVPYGQEYTLLLAKSLFLLQLKCESCGRI